MKKYFPVITLAFLLGLAACETVVEVKLPEHEPQLVVHSLFTPDSLWRVRVANTVSYTGLDQPRLLDQATVEIWDGAQLVERLPWQAEGTYASSVNRPLPGRMYTVRVTAPDYAPVEGQNMLPERIPVEGFRTEVIEAGEEAEFGERSVRVELTLSDPAEVDNYYGLFVYERIEQDNGSGEQTVYWSQRSFVSNDPALGEQDVFETEGIHYDKAYFSDDVFDGRSYTLTFDVPYYRFEGPPEAELTSRFAVLLQPVSEDYYRYRKTADLQDDVGDNPFAEPVQVHSNMSNQFGVFAGYQTQLYFFEDEIFEDEVQ
jgi:hypothetical protein